MCKWTAEPMFQDINVAADGASITFGSRVGMDDNSSQPTNAYGYYGENVHFGGTAIVGKWWLFFPTNLQHPDMTLSFDAHGQAQWEFSNIGDFGRSGAYGVSENGLRIAFDHYDYDYIRIVDHEEEYLIVEVVAQNDVTLRWLKKLEN